MGWSASGVFAYAILEAFSAAGLNLSSDTFKVALYGNSGTPDKTVTTKALTEYNGAASQWVMANEVSGTGYSAGGVSISSPTWTQSTNVVTFTSAGTPQWTGATITTYGGLVYDSQSGQSDAGLCFNYFGGEQVVNSGTLTVTWNASGICAVTT
jgi:hypothetical protein